MYIMNVYDLSLMGTFKSLSVLSGRFPEGTQPYQRRCDVMASHRR